MTDEKPKRTRAETPAVKPGGRVADARLASAPTLRLIEADGILLVGDPHVGSRRPGRRMDEDYGATVVGKVDEAINLANDLRLLVVFLGDMVDLGDENDISVLTRLVRSLRSAWTTPFYLMGNHTLTIGRHAIHHEATDAHTISILLEAGLLAAFGGDGQADAVVRGPDGDIVLGGVGWGHPIPARAEAGWEGCDAALRVMITHHDIELPGRPIPGAKPPKRIAGIDLAVNGHIHDTRVPLAAGTTWWMNPGNIVRQSVDMADHVPSVFELHAGRGPVRDERLGVDLPFGLTRHVLTYRRDVFDQRGRIVGAQAPEGASYGGWEDATTDVGEPTASRFAEMLRDEQQRPRTQDGSVLAEELGRVYEDLGVDPAVRTLIDGLAVGTV